MAMSAARTIRHKSPKSATQKKKNGPVVDARHARAFVIDYTHRTLAAKKTITRKD